MSGLDSVTGSAGIFALHVGAGHSPGQVQGPFAGLSLLGRTSAARANWQQQLASSVEQLGPASPRVSEASPSRAQQQEPPARWTPGDRPAISNMAQESTTGTRTTTAARRRGNPDDPGRAMPLL
ncbi:MAG TPA: hypothetical protein PKC49_00105 [Phycisphaerae bacterium]|nr:hypothetical protein [Phycisphaerae bacterium]